LVVPRAVDVRATIQRFHDKTLGTLGPIEMPGARRDYQKSVWTDHGAEQAMEQRAPFRFRDVRHDVEHDDDVEHLVGVRRPALRHILEHGAMYVRQVARDPRPQLDHAVGVRLDGAERLQRRHAVLDERDLHLAVAAADDRTRPSAVDEAPRSDLLKHRENVFDLIEAPTQRYHYIIVRETRRHSSTENNQTLHIKICFLRCENSGHLGVTQSLEIVTFDKARTSSY